MLKLVFFLILLLSDCLFCGDDFVKVAIEEINLKERSLENLQNQLATVEINFDDTFYAKPLPYFWLGIFASMYRPAGSYELDNFQKFDYGTLKSSPMFKLKISCFPFHIKGSRVGLFADVSYAKQGVDLKTITDIDAVKTYLHSLFTMFGFSFESPFLLNKMFWGVNLGFAKLKFIQSSDMMAARFTDDKNAFLLSPYFRRNFISRLSVYLSYEYLKVYKKNLNPQTHVFYAGFLGELN